MAQQQEFIYVFTDQGVRLLNAFLNKLTNISAEEANPFVQIQAAVGNPMPKDAYDKAILDAYKASLLSEAPVAGDTKDHS